ncbi:tafazzin homolog isoform X2 [Scaptodrosophila lebanonensis]|uniref:Tafazzin family protein n=1 Tax=Drosophila lebanonensis TaxID=7225 RepID=A0A6J2TLJ1_DROLE|nr:tafazzin homolog isoform X2 [Scaptodrosophila lebanonensis]
MRLARRHYVQAPEARTLPDERSLSSPPQKQQQQQKQVEELLCEQVTSQSQGDQQQKQETPENLSKDPSLTMPSSVDVPFNIDWIFPKLRQPSKLWYFISQIVITAVGLFSKFVLVFMNRTRVHNKERLVGLVSKRPKGVPLVTVSNHQSCFDDPGLWGVLPVRYVCNTLRIRWSMAAHDICFTNKYHSWFFIYGKCIPVIRGIGVYQEAINLCIEKCALGHWVHVFPEGKVNMTKEEMRLKWGVGRIIYESPKIPIILPMWHEGMDEVLPNVEPYVLKWRKRVTLNIGQPLDLTDFVQDLKNQQVPEPMARKLITDKIQDAFRELRVETEELHRQQNK